MTAPETSVLLDLAERDALLPCPFCGGAAQRYEANIDTGGSAIECVKCKASTALHFDRKENLVSSWNDRAAEAQLADLVQALLDNDPVEPIADNGMTVLDGWRERARSALRSRSPDVQGK